MKIAYIAHPISGDVKGNLEEVRKIVRQVNIEYPEVLPFAHYWVDCHALDDRNPAERERGIKNDHEFFKRGIIDELWLYGPKISNGMREEVKLALAHKIPIVCRNQYLKPQLEEIVQEHLRQESAATRI